MHILLPNVSFIFQSLFKRVSLLQWGTTILYICPPSYNTPKFHQACIKIVILIPHAKISKFPIKQIKNQNKPTKTYLKPGNHNSPSSINSSFYPKNPHPQTPVSLPKSSLCYQIRGGKAKLYNNSHNKKIPYSGINLARDFYLVQYSGNLSLKLVQLVRQFKDLHNPVIIVFYRDVSLNKAQGLIVYINN